MWSVESVMLGELEWGKRYQRSGRGVEDFCGRGGDYEAKSSVGVPLLNIDTRRNNKSWEGRIKKI